MFEVKKIRQKRVKYIILFLRFITKHLTNQPFKYNALQKDFPYVYSI